MNMKKIRFRKNFLFYQKGKAYELPIKEADRIIGHNTATEVKSRGKKAVNDAPNKMVTGATKTK